MITSRLWPLVHTNPGVPRIVWHLHPIYRPGEHEHWRLWSPVWWLWDWNCAQRLSLLPLGARARSKPLGTYSFIMHASAAVPGQFYVRAIRHNHITSKTQSHQLWRRFFSLLICLLRQQMLSESFGKVCCLTIVMQVRLLTFPEVSLIKCMWAVFMFTWHGWRLTTASPLWLTRGLSTVDPLYVGCYFNVPSTLCVCVCVAGSLISMAWCNFAKGISSGRTHLIRQVSYLVYTWNCLYVFLHNFNLFIKHPGDLI